MCYIINLKICDDRPNSCCLYSPSYPRSHLHVPPPCPSLSLLSSVHYNDNNNTLQATNAPVTIFSLDKEAFSNRVEPAKNALSVLKTLRHPGVIKFITAVELPGHIHLVTERVTPLNIPFCPPPDDAGDADTAGLTASGGISAESLAAAAAGPRRAGSGTGTGGSTTAVAGGASLDLGPHAQPSSSPDSLSALIVLGVYQLTSALVFLSDCGIVHGNINPGTVFVAENGDWKLGGFDLAFKVPQTTVGTPTSSGGAGGVGASQVRAVPPLTRQSWSVQVEAFAPPEFRSQRWAETEAAPVYATDVYALGVLIKELYTKTAKPLNSTAGLAGAGAGSPAAVPAALATVQQQLTSSSASSRPSPASVLQCPFFYTPLISSITFLDRLMVQSAEEKVRFYKSLPTVAASFPLCALRDRVVPDLITALEYSGASDAPFPSLLACVLNVSKMCLTPAVYAKRILPIITRLFKATERAVRVHLLQHVSSYAPFLSSNTIDTEVLPQVLTGFRDTHPLVRDLTVRALPYLAEYLSPDAVEQRILPPLAALQADPSPDLRAVTVGCIAQVARALPRGAQERVLLPVFSRGLRDTHAPTRLACIAGLLATLDVYSAEVCARKIMPYTVPYTLDGVPAVRRAALNLAEGLLTRVRAKVEQLGESEDVTATGGAAGGTLNANAVTVSASAAAPAAAAAAAGQQSGGGGSSGTDVAASALTVASSYLGSVGAWAASTVSSRVTTAVQAALVSGMPAAAAAQQQQQQQQAKSTGFAANGANSANSYGSGSGSSMSSGVGIGGSNTSYAAAASRPSGPAPASSGLGGSVAFHTPSVSSSSSSSRPHNNDMSGFFDSAPAGKPAAAATTKGSANSGFGMSGASDVPDSAFPDWGDDFGVAAASSTSNAQKSKTNANTNAFEAMSFAPPPNHAPVPAPAAAAAAPAVQTAAFDAFGFASSVPAQAPAAAAKNDDWGEFF